MRYAIPRWLPRFVKKWRTEYAVFTVLVYVAAIPITFLVFPNNNLWLALLVTVAGLFDALNSLADRIGDAEEDKPDEHLC